MSWARACASNKSGTSQDAVALVCAGRAIWANAGLSTYIQSGPEQDVDAKGYALLPGRSGSWKAKTVKFLTSWAKATSIARYVK